ncbi:hypothetical protein RvY_02986-1 [Ramazzottius varieornatus]|uniref:Large ribosomal subunit protein uL16m n=1 Tax=Ramazzottius varieornatus TaxID=947166 RepID=A0A1D1UWQ8_RAMVA|nr:hypothetical protein RvY_02986-1 [Ramazzottius varieornatus]
MARTCLQCATKVSRRMHDFLAVMSAYRTVQVAGLKDYRPPNTYTDVDFPPADLTRDNKLKGTMKVPLPPPNMKSPRFNRGLDLMRGPEEIHNTFTHKQFGIVALQGGRLRHGHFEMIRQTINRNLDASRMFAIWRVDPPWFSVTKKGQGTRMGGGKGPVNHYVTPIKEGRVIIEVGGRLQYEEIRRCLEDVAAKLPVKAIATTHKQMEHDRQEEQRREQLNLNPFSTEYVLKNNMVGCNKWTSPYDYLWFGKYK